MLTLDECATYRLDPSKPELDLKEGFNIGFIDPGPPHRATHALPNLMLAHIEKLADFQVACFDLCQRLLTAFAHVLEVRPARPPVGCAR